MSPPAFQKRVRVQTVAEIEDALARAGVYRLGRVRRGAVDDGGAAAVQDDAVQAVRVGRADDLRVRLALRPRAAATARSSVLLPDPGEPLSM